MKHVPPSQTGENGLDLFRDIKKSLSLDPSVTSQGSYCKFQTSVPPFFCHRSTFLVNWKPLNTFLALPVRDFQANPLEPLILRTCFNEVLSLRTLEKLCVFTITWEHWVHIHDNLRTLGYIFKETNKEWFALLEDVGRYPPQGTWTCKYLPHSFSTY